MGCVNQNPYVIVQEPSPLINPPPQLPLPAKIPSDFEASISQADLLIVCKIMSEKIPNKVAVACQKITTSYVGDCYELDKFRILLLSKKEREKKFGAILTNEVLLEQIDALAWKINKLDCAEKRDLIKNFLSLKYPEYYIHIFICSRGKQLLTPDLSGCAVYAKLVSSDVKDYGHDIFVLFT